jgi:hypothetical protein
VSRRQTARFSRIRGAIGLCLLLWSGQAYAEGRGVGTTWSLKPVMAIDAPFEMRSGTTLIARLLPPALIRLTSPLADATTGEELLTAGTQLFQVMHKTKTVYCTTQPSRRWGGLPWRAPLAHLCLVDSDGDHVFDGSFKIRTEVPGTLIIRGAHPEQLDPLKPATYEQLPVEQFDNDFSAFVVRYGRSISFFVGRDESHGAALSGWIKIPKDAPTFQFNFAGARIELIRKDEKSWESRMVSLDEGVPITIEPNWDLFRKYD